jgi:hypothetical protein
MCWLVWGLKELPKRFDLGVERVKHSGGGGSLNSSCLGRRRSCTQQRYLFANNGKLFQSELYLGRKISRHALTLRCQGDTG